MDLLIIAAGKGSRMGGHLPKALVPITNEPCLTTTLKQAHNKFDTVYVVVNVLLIDVWNSYLDDLRKSSPSIAANVKLVPIHSGLGDGHAVFSAIRAIEKTSDALILSDHIVIMWGDVFVMNSEIFDELLSKDFTGGVVGYLPAVREDTPYVTLLVDEQMRCVSADYSKYGEKHPSGFHDQSIFIFDTSEILSALIALHNAFWKGGRYITPGGELSLLHTFHYLYNTSCDSCAVVYETDYPTLSFNTTDEVVLIQQEINSKWLHKNS